MDSEFYDMTGGELSTDSSEARPMQWPAATCRRLVTRALCTSTHRRAAAPLALAFLVLFVCGSIASCSVQGDECDDDSDCATDEYCQTGGGIFVRGSICLPGLDASTSSVPTDVAPDETSNEDTDSPPVGDASSSVDTGTEDSKTACCECSGVGECANECPPDGDCSLECQAATDCSLSCLEGADCEITACRQTECELSCAEETDCKIDICSQASCALRCSGPDCEINDCEQSRCEIECLGGTCKVDNCSIGSECRLSCESDDSDCNLECDGDGECICEGSEGCS